MFSYVCALVENILDILQYEFEDTGIDEFVITPLRETMENWWYSFAYSEDNCVHPLPVIYIVLLFVCVGVQRVYKNKMALGSSENRKKSKYDCHENGNSKMLVHTLLSNLTDLKYLIQKEKILEVTRVKLLNLSNGLKKKRFLKEYQRRINNVNLVLKKVELLDEVQERLERLCRIAEQDNRLKLVQEYLKELSRFVKEVRRSREGRGRMPNLLEPLALIRCEITTLVKMLAVYGEAKVQTEHDHKAPAQEAKSARANHANSQLLQNKVFSSMTLHDRCCQSKKSTKEHNIILKIVVNSDSSTCHQEEIILDNIGAEDTPPSSGGSGNAATEIIDPPTPNLLNVTNSTDYDSYKTASVVMDALAHDCHQNAIKSFPHEQSNNKSFIIDSWGYSYYKNLSSLSSEEKAQQNRSESVSECSFVKNKVKQIEASNVVKTCEIDTNKLQEIGEKSNCNTLNLLKLELGDAYNKECENILKDNLEKASEN